MSKVSNRILLIIGLLAVSLFVGCGVTSTSLPSNLQPSGGTPLAILTTTLADAIQSRTYYLQVSTSGGSGDLRTCSDVVGTLPTGLQWSVNPTQLNVCVLSGTVTGTAGAYSIVMEATDSNGKTAQLPYTLTVRNDFSVCAGPTSAVTGCSASSPAAMVTSFPSAVQGRPYGTSPLSQIVATNLNGTADASPVNHPNEFGNGPFTSASSITGLPPGIAYAAAPAQSDFVVSSTAAGASGTYTVTVSITDRPITVSTQALPVVPARTLTQTYTQIVLPPIQLAQSLGTTWPDAVNGRPYGGAAAGCFSGAASVACASAVYTASNGLGNYVWPTTLPASISAIAGMSCAAASTTYTCSAPKITAGSSTPGAASTTFNPSVTVTDTANTATPAATVSTDPQSTRTDALVVDAPLLAVLTQNGTTNPASLIAGVSGRSYGSGNNCAGGACAVPTYTATGGLGAGVLGVTAYEWCVNSGAASLPAGLGGIGTSCSPFTTTGAATETLTSSNITATITPPSQNFSFTVELDDVGNGSTPGSVATGTSATRATSLLMNAALVVRLTQAGSTIANNGSLLPAVYNRSYGVIGGGSGIPTYTASYGLGGYVFPASPGPFSTVGGFACSSTTANPYTCSASTSVTANPGTYTPLGLTVSDTANAAVPAGNATSTASLLVDPQITLAQSLGTHWPDAVNGRAYGSPAGGPAVAGCTGGNCAPAVYMASGGLGGYIYPGGTPTSVPTGFACVQGTGASLANYTCSAASVTAGSSTPGAASVTLNPIVSVTDTANAATPAATTATDPLSIRSPANANPSYVDTVNVDAPLLATLTQTGNATPATSLITGVAGRSYGAGSSCSGGPCAAPTYAATGGLGTAAYEWCVQATSALPPTGLGPGGVSPTAKCPTYFTTGVTPLVLTASPIAASTNINTNGAQVSYPFTVELDDTGNTSTPSSAASSAASSVAPTTLPIFPKIQLAQSLGATWPAAVHGRSYGTSTGCTGAAGACSPASYSATGGLGPPYNWPATTPTTLASLGMTCSVSSGNYVCSASSISAAPNTAGSPSTTYGPGTNGPTLTVADNANGATPAANTTTDPNSTRTDSLTVNSQILLSQSLGSHWPDAVYGRPYGSPAGGPAVTGCTGTGGTCSPANYSGAGGLGPPYNWPATTPTTLASLGLACSVSSGNYVCSATSVTAGSSTAGGASATYGPGTNGPALTVTDNANASTPASNTTTDPQSTRTDTIVVDAPLLATLTQATISGNNPANLLDAVVNRSYGVKGSPPTYQAAGGLGANPATTGGLGTAAYEWCAAAASGLPPTGLGPGAVSVTAKCPSFFSTGAASLTLTANPVALSANTTATAKPYPFTVELDDVGNGSTPASSAAATTASDVAATTLTVQPPLTAALKQNGATVASGNPLLPGVFNRSYGVIGGTPTFSASGGLGSSTLGLGAYEWCISSLPAQGLPAGFLNTGTNLNNSSVCSSEIVENTATLQASTMTIPVPAPTSATNYPFTIQLDDQGNAAVPGGVSSSTVNTISTSILVNPQLTVSTNLSPAPWPDAVQNRAYGQGTGCTGTGGGCTAMVYTAANGLGAVGGYTFPVISNFPTSLSPGCVTSSPRLTCSTAKLTDSPATFHPTVTAVDVANAATPAATTTTDPSSVRPSTDTLTIYVSLGITLTQATNATPTTALFGGVAGRTYGIAATAPTVGAPPTYTAAGGLGAGAAGVAAYEWCVNTGATSIPTGLSGIGPSCSPFTTTGASTETLTGNPISSNATAQTYHFTVELDDTGNSSTPSSVAANPAATSATVATSLPLSAALAVNVTSPTGLTSLPAAVVDRDYGINTDSCPGNSGGKCAPLIYTASGGLLNASGAYASITPNSTGLTTAGAGFPQNLTCTSNSPLTALTCTASPLSATVAAGTYTPSVTVTDTANSSTPVGTASPPAAFQTLQVNPQITFTCNSTPNAVCIGNAAYTASSAWPAGVSGRPYGATSGGTYTCASGATCESPTYTATGGLSTTYDYVPSTTFTSTTGLNFACTPATTASSPAASVNCSSPDVKAGSGSYSPQVTAVDSANQTTPAAITSAACPTPGPTCTDPQSILTSSLSVNPEIVVLNPFLENATVGEPFAANLDSSISSTGSPCTALATANCGGLGPPYTWSAVSGGIAGVCFVPGGSSCPTTPAIPFGDPEAPSDDASVDIRGYYQGTPTTATSEPVPATTFQVVDLGNATTPPACSGGGVTCPQATVHSKVSASNGFAATLASGATEQGDTLFAFGTSSPFTSPFNLKLDANGNPVTPRVTPDGNWVYVTEYGPHQVAVVDPTTGAEAISSVTVSNTGTFNPEGLDIEPQKFFTANPTACSAHCSNLNPFIRYDAYLSDPTDGSQTTATVEPIPDAENPGALPATLLSGNALTVADANNIAVSADGTQAFLSLNYEPSGSACATPPCNTLAVLGLPALSSTAATSYTSFTTQTPTTFNTFGLRAGAVTVDPRGNYVATATRDNTGTYTYLTVTTTGATPTFVTYVPTTAGPTNTVNVCSASGTTFSPVAAVPTAIVASPEGNRLFIACEDINTPQVNNTVGVWDISGTSSGVPFVQSIALPASSGSVTDAENGCTTPVDIKAKLTTSTTYGLRLFVSCQDSDTVVPIEYNSGAGSLAVDSSLIDGVVSTDSTPITNTTIGNTTTYTNYACGNTGSCPQLLDLMPNPALHFTTGGYVATPPFELPSATHGSAYSYYVAAQGGAVPRTFSETTATPVLGQTTGSSPCVGLSLSSDGLISGTPSNAGACGPFTLRVTDGSTPGQFVERAFSITVN